MHVDGAKRIETCCPPVRNSRESGAFDLVKCGDRSSGCTPQSCWSASGRGPGYFAPLPARFQCTTMAYCKCTICARQQPLGPVDVGPSSEGSSRLLDSRQPSSPGCACGGSLNKRTRQAMTSASHPTGPFTCEIALRRIRAPQFVREDKQGVTYMVARGYELGYETVLHFANGARLPVQAKLIGELNQRVVIRDVKGRPVRLSGYTQGLAEILDSSGAVIFRGRYYDSRT